MAAVGARAGVAALVTLAVGAVGAAYGVGHGLRDGDRFGPVAGAAGAAPSHGAAPSAGAATAPSAGADPSGGVSHGDLPHGDAQGDAHGGVPHGGAPHGDRSHGGVSPDGALPGRARPDGVQVPSSDETRHADGTRLSGSVGAPAAGEGVALRAYGRFTPPGSFVPSTALTYDRTLVPAGAWIVVEQSTERSGTVVRARVGGVKPGHAFGAHVHTAPCDADPAGAGPHYQHLAAPGAAPANELWLDFTADAAGEGNAETRHRWGLRRGGAQSVVLHAEQGGAGTRVACFTVPFGGYGTP